MFLDFRQRRMDRDTSAFRFRGQGQIDDRRTQDNRCFGETDAFRRIDRAECPCDSRRIG